MRAASSVPVRRIAWRPSRWEAGGLGLVGVCAAVGALTSGLASPWAELLACAAVGIAGLQGMRGWRRPVRWLVVSQEAVLDDVPLERVRLRWRGSLAFFQARDATGRTHRLAWWPDTLDATGRRALRLAIDGLQHPAR